MRTASSGRGGWSTPITAVTASGRPCSTGSRPEPPSSSPASRRRGSSIPSPRATTPRRRCRRAEAYGRSATTGTCRSTSTDRSIAGAQPDGIDVGAFVPTDDELRAVHAVIQAAFLTTRGITRTLRRWVNEHASGRSFDPGLWLIARDGATTVGALTGSAGHDAGWVDWLAVCRPTAAAAWIGAPPPYLRGVRRSRDAARRPQRGCRERDRRDGRVRARRDARGVPLGPLGAPIATRRLLNPTNRIRGQPGGLALYC